MEQLSEATSAGCGAVVSTLALYPVNKVKVRLQAERKQANEAASSFRSMAQRMLREEGALSIYYGSFTACSKGFWNNFVFYFAFALLRRWVFGLAKKGGKPSMLRSMLHGISAGLCVQLIMSPYDTALTQVMTYRGGKQGGGGSLLGTVRRIWRESGFGGFYSGIVPMLVLTLNPGITTVVRTQLTRGRRLSPRQNFWIGAASKAVASTCTYPIVIAKVQLQARRRADSLEQELVGGLRRRASSSSLDPTEAESAQAAADLAAAQASNSRPPTMAGCLLRIVKSHGVAGLYAGCGVQVGQSVAKEAILNTVRVEIYQVVTGVFKRLMGGS